MFVVAQMYSNLLPLLIYIIGALFVLVFMYGASYLLGQRHVGRETNLPYESGIKSTGTARLHFTVKFYLVAILFVVFDLEAAIIFGWAVAARELGWAGYLGMLVFVAILAAGLIYEWKMGALDWMKSKRTTIRREDDNS